MENTVRWMAIVAVLLALMPGAPARAAGVGFQKVDIPNGAEPPLTAGIWYPTDATPLPRSLGDLTRSVAADAPVASKRVPIGASFAVRVVLYYAKKSQPIAKPSIADSRTSHFLDSS
ncbi:hypothetical protein QF000_006894 [Paraburkholderia atlantica]|uniref:hypothetical protein n=1 Tax=Paraburkholderia atlantica TaxID=2654982 RepID=UPI003D235AF5